MEYKLEQLKKIKTITLTNEERGLIRSHAARLIMTEVHAPVPSLFFRGVQHGLRIALSAMFFVVFVGGSVSAIADSALPGDPLYSFKLNVNEEVKGAFLKTPEEKVVWQKNRIENRVNEIKTLADSNTLTQAKQEKAKQAISVHVQELSKELTVLSEESPDTALTVTASLEQSLKSSRGRLQAKSDESSPVAATMMMRSKVAGDEPVAPEDGITAALRTVNEALDQVSKEEVKILTKEIDNISKDVTTVDVQENASSNTLNNSSSESSTTSPDGQ